MSRCRRVPAAAIGVTALLAFGWDVTLPPAEAQSGAVIQVDAAVDRHPIDERIYGVAGGSAEQRAALNFTLRRWGGNPTSRHNWKTNGDNRGRDWYFESIPGSGAPGQAFDEFVLAAHEDDMAPLLTIPLIGWVGRNGPGGTKLASFSAAKYGSQEDCDWEWFPDACNGVRPDGTHVTGNDPNDASVAVGPQYQKAWVEHLVSEWGPASGGGVRYYLYDNEPSIWFATHRDVHPAGLTMSEARDLMVAYGTAIKEADPGALLAGPEEWGWSAYFLSGYDQKYGRDTGCWTCAPDRTSQGGMDYVPWLLDQMRQHEQATGNRLLDILSLHYYPQGGEFGDDTSSAMQQRRNRSTRSLWDPDYVDETWINDKVRLIPRMKEWVATRYPGLDIGITEYNWGAEGHINGATTQADILGIFGREGLDIGSRWRTPAVDTPTFKAMQMYRNYDGQRSVFGDISVQATVPDPDTLSAFAAERTSDGALTVMAINKVLSSATVTLGLAGFSAGPAAEVWRLTSSNSIQHLSDVAVSANGLSTTLPAQSITLFVIPGAADPTPAGPPFGSFDTPSNGTSGVTGAVAVTGWALDDTRVTTVEIYRTALAGEATASNGQVYVGDATFVAGARPDVAAQYSAYPEADRAGWGYMVLTNMLPNQGNGSFTLHAWARDDHGGETLLGSRTITCSNVSAVKPFGTLDTPAQGGTTSGNAYMVWGWALTPPPGAIPASGATLQVYVDGTAVGTPTYDLYRSDVAQSFPGYANSDGAIFYYVLDTTPLSNGIHTIAVSVADDLGRTEGIGSRFFWVEN